MSAQLEARAFAIWRYAKPRDWDCSYEEIVDATGMRLALVKTAIRAKGWGGRIGAGRRAESNDAAKWKRTAIAAKSRGGNFDENALDLCQLVWDA